MKAKIKIMPGMRFGRLVTIKKVEKLPNDKGKHNKWLCQCDCGNTKVARSNLLRNGQTKSCGCLMKETAAKNSKSCITHGLAFKTPLYTIWSGMKQRCYYLNSKHYKDYGGRGICICHDWRENFKSFYDWAVNNGYKKGLTIDRIDCNGNYEPSNCRWITIIEQSRNKRSNRLLEYKGEVKPLIEWCEILGLKYSTIRARLNKYHWSVEKSFNKPIKKHNNGK
jgi:hypothetical protein